MPPAIDTFRLDKKRLFERLRYEPHAGQLEVHRSTAARRVLACGVRWGKSLCAAMEAIAAALEPKDRSVGWVVAPTYDLADKIFRELGILVVEHLRHRIITVKDSERKIVIRNLGGSVPSASTADTTRLPRRVGCRTSTTESIPSTCSSRRPPAGTAAATPTSPGSAGSCARW